MKQMAIMQSKQVNYVLILPGWQSFLSRDAV